MRVFSLKMLTAAFGVVILLIITAANAAPELLHAFYRVPGGDKFAHFMLTGIMALLLNLSLQNRRFKWGQLSILCGSAAVMTFMTAEEFSQIWIATRSASFLDLMANISGITIIGSLSTLLPTGSRLLEKS